MSNRTTIKIEGAKVAFCSVTKPEGHKNGKHLLGVYVDKKFKKKIEAEFAELWAENKTAKAKKPVYSMDDWFSKDEESGEIIFWLTAKADKERGIVFKQGDDCDFSEDDFGKIGTGSIIDVSFDVYYFNSSDYGEMISRSIKAISLLELVPYEDDGGVGGKSVEMSKKKKKSDDDDEGSSKKDKKKKKKKSDDDDDDVEEEAPKKEKKKKKKKKSKEED